MKSLVQNLKERESRPVLVVGDLMIDEYIFGSVHRISPEAPVPVVREERRERYLGGAANTAANCKVLNLDVSLVGLVSRDDVYGPILKQLLEASNIATTGIVFSSFRKTTVKNRVIANNHHCLRVDNEDNVPLKEQELSVVVEKIKQLLQPGSIILLSDYAKGIITSELITIVKALADERGCTIIADPKGAKFAKYQGLDFLKPNLAEFRQVAHELGIQEELPLVARGKEVCVRLGLKGIFVTLGEKGIHFISGDTDIYSPAYKREVFDLSGAGDTVFAYLALAFAHGVDMVNALRLANKAASIAVSHFKTYAVRLDELLDGKDSFRDKIAHDWVDLKKEIDVLRGQGKRLVFTNGCFDILHAGHVHCLYEAKRYGDILVVALNADESIRRLNKGPERPINSLQDRAEVMAGLGMVDFVTSFSQDTPQEIIDYLKPDVLVKGGDYKKEELVGYGTVMASGGSVHTIPLVRGKSTTNMIQKAFMKKDEL